MPTVIQRRQKCIGCNYCVELAPDFWRMSRKDGKSVLLGATEKKGNYILKIAESDKAANLRAAEACPVKIIEVRD